jgi:hypothetical protein
LWCLITLSINVDAKVQAATGAANVADTDFKVSITQNDSVILRKRKA